MARSSSWSCFCPIDFFNFFIEVVVAAEEAEEEESDILLVGVSAAIDRIYGKKGKLAFV